MIEADGGGGPPAPAALHAPSTARPGEFRLLFGRTPSTRSGARNNRFLSEVDSGERGLAEREHREGAWPRGRRTVVLVHRKGPVRAGEAQGDERIRPGLRLQWSTATGTRSGLDVRKGAVSSRRALSKTPSTRRRGTGMSVNFVSVERAAAARGEARDGRSEEALRDDRPHSALRRLQGLRPFVQGRERSPGRLSRDWVVEEVCGKFPLLASSLAPAVRTTARAPRA